MSTLQPSSRATGPEECVLPYILARQAAATPERVFAVFDDGAVWSYADTRIEALRVAAGLARCGVGRGDGVLIWMPNGRRALAAWLGVGHLGAVSVAINTAYRGRLLAHVVANSDARVAICHEGLLERLLEEDFSGAITTIFTAADAAALQAARFAAHGITLLPFEALDGDPDSVSVPDLKPWDLQSICYTSGTTGPSKGVLSSYRHLHTQGWHFTGGLAPDDRHLVNLPLFHAGGTLFVTGALARGASVAVTAPFHQSTFLDLCRTLRVTRCLLLGAMAGLMARTPPRPDDRNHALKRVVVIPLTDSGEALAERFGVAVWTLYSMTEISVPIISGLNPRPRGTCGRLRPGIEARIVDENDCEVADGTVGELMLRSDTPWTLSHGYHHDAAATARAWRNGWFHTGDAFRRDAAGNYFFADRLKDAIRRRGENISSFEVEAEILAHPAVLEAAAVGVPSVLSEEEVLAVVVPRPGHVIDATDLVNFLSSRLPSFMVPRYVRVVAALPKTPTAKIEKHVLRAEGITADTWSKEGAAPQADLEAVAG